MTDDTAGFVILGMHRSGTSLVANLLGAAGAHLGDRLMSPSPSNPKGYGEELFVVETNDALLHALGLWWADPRALPDGWFDSAPAIEARLSIGEFATQVLGRHRLWAIKDPRLCRLAPLWFTACQPRHRASSSWYAIPRKWPRRWRSETASTPDPRTCCGCAT